MTQPVLALIAAMGGNRVIGINNKLPWYLPADLAHFKQLTMAKPMIMGRKTWESLPGLLPGRPHIVVTRDPAYQAKGAAVAHSLEAAIDQAIAQVGEDGEVMLIGGANLYAQALPLAQRLYLTEVDVSPAGDAWFPALDLAEWQLDDSESYPSDLKNPYSYRFLSYSRR